MQLRFIQKNTTHLKSHVVFLFFGLSLFICLHQCTLHIYCKNKMRYLGHKRQQVLYDQPDLYKKLTFLSFQILKERDNIILNLLRMASHRLQSNFQANPTRDLKFWSFKRRSSHDRDFLLISFIQAVGEKSPSPSPHNENHGQIKKNWCFKCYHFGIRFLKENDRYTFVM